MKKLASIILTGSLLGNCLFLMGCGSSEATNTDGSTTTLTTKTPSSVIDNTDMQVPVSENWALVWSDEFDDNKIDLSKWSHEVNCFGGGNDEKQCYTADSQNAFVEGGRLHLVAIKGQSTGPSKHDDDPEYDINTTRSQSYSSARLRTKHKGDWKYGRFEISAQLPAGQGVWPAIWMLPTDWAYGHWPLSGEIDIMEAVNLKSLSDDVNADSGQLEARVHGTLHYGNSPPKNVYSGTSYTLNNYLNPADDFHQYAIEWEDGEIRWYVDGVHYATQRQAGWFSQSVNAQGEVITQADSAPFDKRFHLLLNLAIGGNWPENVNEKGIADNINSKTMKIDYVRIYQCSLSASTGKGCAAISPQAKLVTDIKTP